MKISKLYEQLRIALLPDLPQDGNPDYKPISELSLVVDHPDWPTPKRVSLGDFNTGGTGSFAGYTVDELIEAAESKTITYTFPAAFNSIPVDIGFRVYKMVEFESGKFLQQDVLHYFPANWKDTGSFTIVIDDSEDLTGVYIKGLFIEKS